MSRQRNLLIARTCAALNMAGTFAVKVIRPWRAHPRECYARQTLQWSILCWTHKRSIGVNGRDAALEAAARIADEDSALVGV